MIKNKKPFTFRTIRGLSLCLCVIEIVGSNLREWGILFVVRTVCSGATGTTVIFVCMCVSTSVLAEPPCDLHGEGKHKERKITTNDLLLGVCDTSCLCICGCVFYLISIFTHAFGIAKAQSYPVP